MAINAGSRYETSTVDYFRKVEGNQTYPITLYKFDSLTSVSFYLHTLVEGETLQGLADQYFNRPDLWWAIAEYNPEVTDFVHLQPGTQIRIPSA